MSQAILTTPDGAWSVSLVKPPCVLPLPLVTALEMGTAAAPLPALPNVTEKAAGLSIERGLITGDAKEYFVSGAEFAGILLIKRKDDGSWGASLSKSFMPRILTKEALDTGLMPPDGTHCLPESLASVVPAELQYWKQKGEQARVVRDKLAKSGLFEDRLIKVVDGKLRLCVERLYLYVPDGEPQPLDTNKVAALKRILGKRASLEVDTPLLHANWPQRLQTAKADTLLVLSSPTEDMVAKVCAQVVATTPTAPWLVEHTDTKEARESMAKIGRVFKLDADPDSIYVASFALADSHGVSWIDEAERIEAVEESIETSLALVVGALDKEIEAEAAAAAESDVTKGGVGSNQYGEKPGGADPAEAKGLAGMKGASKVEVKQFEKAMRMAKILHQMAKDKIASGDVIGAQAALNVAERHTKVMSSIYDKVIGRQERAADRKALKNEDAVGPAISKVIAKAEEAAPSAERFVLGIVLEPEVKDSQGDIYSADEIRKACHAYMEKYRGTGLMHKESTADKVVILENFIAPSDCTIADQPIKAGTWIQGVRVIDEAIWKGCFDGSYTGFSIGGSAVRKPEKTDPPTADAA